MEDKPILITGTGGFIGFHLARRLLEEERQVVGVDAFNHYYHPAVKEGRSEILQKYPNFTEKRLDVSCLSDLEAVFKEYKPWKVCHLAAQAGVRYSIDHPHVYENSNVAAFLNILEMVRHHDVPRLVYASSSSVYGGNKKIPFSESDPVDTPISLYAATKRANELMAHCYTHLYKFQTIGLRFFTVYGPWGRPDMAMWLFAEAIRKGSKIKVFNHGNMKRDFTYIDDIVSGIHAALFKDNLDPYEVFNLGNHRSEQLNRMISLIEDAMGKKTERELLPMQPGDVPESFADIDKARQKLGFEPTTPIDKGIPSFIQWYKDHADLTEIVMNSR